MSPSRRQSPFQLTTKASSTNPNIASSYLSGSTSSPNNGHINVGGVGPSEIAGQCSAGTALEGDVFSSVGCQPTWLL